MSLRTRRRILVTAIQAILIGGFFLGWEFLPRVEAIRSLSHLLDPFFISSPSRIFHRLADLATGANGSVLLWPYLWPTLGASLVGTVAGMITGAAVGLFLSNSVFWSQVFRPIVVAVNTVPRIALIPILVIVFGITFKTTVAISILVVFFVVFFNAFEGGRSVSPHLLQNASILGATSWHLMRHVRLPYVFAWTLASLPLALTFSLLSVVTGELLTGYKGLGTLLSVATVSAEASLTFAVVGVLSLVGMVVVGLAELGKRRVLHWWTQG